MHVRRTVFYKDGNVPAVPVDFDIKILPAEDQVRVGFEKGTLQKATFELHHNVSVTYERVDDPTAPENDRVSGWDSLVRAGTSIANTFGPATLIAEGDGMDPHGNRWINETWRHHQPDVRD